MNEELKLDPNAINKDGYTNLMQFIFRSEMDKIKECLADEQVNVEIQQAHDKNTALMFALANYTVCSDMDILRKLVNKKTVNLQDSAGNTPLMQANCDAALASTDICDLLITQGADINMKNKKGENALMIALSKGIVDRDVLKLLISKDVLNAQDVDGNSALIYAINGSCTVDIVKLLISSDNINLRNENRYTPLMMAVQIMKNNGINKDVLNLLINEGADIHLRRKDKSVLTMKSSKEIKTVIQEAFTKKEVEIFTWAKELLPKEAFGESLWDSLNSGVIFYKLVQCVFDLNAPAWSINKKHREKNVRGALNILKASSDIDGFEVNDLLNNENSESVYKCLKQLKNHLVGNEKKEQEEKKDEKDNGGHKEKAFAKCICEFIKNHLMVKKGLFKKELIDEKEEKVLLENIEEILDADILEKVDTTLDLEDGLKSNVVGKQKHTLQLVEFLCEELRCLKEINKKPFEESSNCCLGNSLQSGVLRWKFKIDILNNIQTSVYKMAHEIMGSLTNNDDTQGQKTYLRCVIYTILLDKQDEVAKFYSVDKSERERFLNSTSSIINKGNDKSFHKVKKQMMKDNAAYTKLKTSIAFNISEFRWKAIDDGSIGKAQEFQAIFKLQLSCKIYSFNQHVKYMKNDETWKDKNKQYEKLLEFLKADDLIAMHKYCEIVANQVTNKFCSQLGNISDPATFANALAERALTWLKNNINTLTIECSTVKKIAKEIPVVKHFVSKDKTQKIPGPAEKCLEGILACDDSEVKIGDKEVYSDSEHTKTTNHLVNYTVLFDGTNHWAKQKAWKPVLVKPFGMLAGDQPIELSFDIYKKVDAKEVHKAM